MRPREPLPIRELAERHPGLTHAVAESYHEAARVCLHRHHISPSEFTIQNGDDTLEAVAYWDPPDARVMAAWANDIDATEAGGYACAIAAVELAEGLFAIRRAETRTGADYYIGGREAGADDLENCLRLEVSGTHATRRATVEYRLREKVEQAQGGRSNLPAVAAVVGFSVRLILMERVATL